MSPFSRIICKFVLKHTSSFSNIICEFSNIFPSSLASSWLAGWRRVSARGKWVDTSPNYSPPEDLCYPPTNKLTKFSSPAHATHCSPASLGLAPTIINSEQTSLVIISHTLNLDIKGNYAGGKPLIGERVDLIWASIAFSACCKSWAEPPVSGVVEIRELADHHHHLCLSQIQQFSILSVIAQRQAHGRK